ncbi:MAG: hypothetical protein JJT89_08130 [Nitriliruptoraceae bacterium]|nr:hypothetical protein [Nitriliruptoraceae bacterium]
MDQVTTGLLASVALALVGVVAMLWGPGLGGRLRAVLVLAAGAGLALTLAAPQRLGTVLLLGLTLGPLLATGVWFARRLGPGTSLDDPPR